MITDSVKVKKLRRKIVKCNLFFIKITEVIGKLFASYLAFFIFSELVNKSLRILVKMLTKN